MSKRKDRRRAAEDSASPVKAEVRIEKRETRTTGKATVINSKANQQQAKANKWKWLSILIGICIAAYMGFKSKIFGG